MKILKWSLISVLGLILTGGIGIYFWLRSSAPVYEGKIEIPGLEQEVQAWFDEYGVPHIEASNRKDLYIAFGYLHAQDRLFQMELLRRAGDGRLAEVLGEKLIKADLLFRTIGTPDYATRSAALMASLGPSDMADDIQAYLDGINAFVDQGPTPPEFSIIGIPKTHFTVRDIFCITGAMAFSFSQAQKTDPVLDIMNRKFGKDYLEDLGVWHDSTESFIPTCGAEGGKEVIPLRQDTGLTAALIEADLALATAMNTVEKSLPFAPLLGSNSWVIDGGHTESGQVMFCNDTHIGYLLPQTWYEAWLSSPGFSIYGHFMAGVPFALVGRNHHLSWGLTMLLNDDMDFYAEELNPANPLQVKVNDHYEDMKIVHDTIRVKGGNDTLIEIRSTRHGPLINGIFEQTEGSTPLSMFWSYTRMENYTLKALHGMNHASDFATFESNLASIHGPGLSVNYGDRMGNIAWWACAALIHRPEHVNPLTILDGASGHDEPLGYYPFGSNPRCINPEGGMIYSANDWPAPVDSLWYPGYYKPQYRADRIRTLLSGSRDMTLESMSAVMCDVKSTMDSSLHSLFAMSVIHDERYSGSYRLTYDLWDWDGTYLPDLCQPTLYNKMLYLVMKKACSDEMGNKAFELFTTTHQFQRAQWRLLTDSTSVWWDDVRTPSVETRDSIIWNAFAQSVDELTRQFDTNPKIWTWGKACHLELRHPLGEVALFRPFFNIGPEEIWGGNETIRQSGFMHDSTGEYKVHFGSQMRIMVDFAHPDSAWNITPAGQSGHIMSKHYSDQSEKYNQGEFRVMRMNPEAYRTGEALLLVPAAQ